jgi:hypothetical protein
MGALDASTDNFFASVRGGDPTSDPRVRFDRISGRWFVTIITVAFPNRVLIAVSSGAVLTGSASFTFFSSSRTLRARSPTPTTAPSPTTPRWESTPTRCTSA